MIIGEVDQSSGSMDMQSFPENENSADWDSPTRWLPDWLMLRMPRFHLPAPLVLAVIVATLLGAIMAPRLAINGRTAMIAGIILAVTGLVILVKWRILGLAILPIAGLMVPFTIGTGSQTGINAAIVILGLLLGLWLLDMIARQRRIRLLPYRPVIASLIFGVVVIVAFGFGQLPWFGIQSATITAQLGGLVIFLMSIGAFLLVAHQVQTIHELKWMTGIFLAVGFAFFTYRLFPASLYFMERIFVQTGVFGASFYIWLIAMASSQALFNQKLTPVWRILAGLLVVMLFYANMVGEVRMWISGWLPSLIVLVVILLLGKPKLGLFVLAIGGLILLINTGLITGVANEGDNTYSINTRVEAWRIMAEIIKVSPIFGLGMANYYFYTPLFPILGYKISFNSHNNYIDIIAQTGLVGLLCFLWFIGELWLLGWYMRNRVPEGFPRAYVIGSLAGIVGTLFLAALGDWVIPFVYNVGLEGFRASMFGFLFLGGLVAIANIYHINPSKSIEPQTR